MTLTELRDALAAATGPDRELDVALAQTIWPQLTQYNTYCVGDDEPLFFADPFYKQPCPRFTASIDAAVTLVPEHMGCRMYLRSAGAVFRPPSGPEIEIAAPTLPLALCLARIEYEIAKEKTR